jgi:ATPase subunit of ABC transporter with duplicated ATPase domains
MPAVVLSDLHFSLPNGSVLLSGLSASFGPGRTGLIGVNGAGKSTLLRLIAGELRPSSGAVTVAGEVGYLPQNLTLDVAAPVAALLGIGPAVAALRAIEAGDTSPGAFDAVGDDWDIADRAREWLDRLGLRHIGLGDPVGRLSGGEAIMTALTGLFVRRPAVILLDEPTNNLDLDARSRLYDAVSAWPGVLLAVSHDRTLLSQVDRIAEVSGGSLRMYGGNLAAYEAQREAEQAAALRAVSAASADLRREKRDLVENQVKQARRDRMGRRVADSGSLPKAVTDERRRSAQETAGRNREVDLERIAAASARLTEAEDAVRDDAKIRVSLPGTAVPAGRTLLTVRGLDGDWIPWRAAGGQDSGSGRRADGDARSSEADQDGGPGGQAVRDSVGTLAELIVRGPERLALTGPNGAGKTTMLHVITGELASRVPGLAVRRTEALGYLPQRLDVLDDSLTVVENVRAVAPAASPNEVRAGLARFLFRGTRADQLAGTLSGGERFRAVLAALLLADPPPQLLLLDEPTNSLDMASVRQLSQALSCYQGALLVASHDLPFLRSIGVTRWLRLDAGGRLTDVDPL